jgi:hypothetical protein
MPDQSGLKIFNCFRINAQYPSWQNCVIHLGCDNDYLYSLIFVFCYGMSKYGGMIQVFGI